MKKNINILVSHSTHTDLKILAAELGLTQGELLRFLLDFFNDYKPSQEPEFYLQQIENLN